MKVAYGYDYLIKEQNKPNARVRKIYVNNLKKYFHRNQAQLNASRDSSKPSEHSNIAHLNQNKNEAYKQTRREKKE